MKLALIGLVAWGLGVLSALGYIAASGYEYEVAAEVAIEKGRWSVISQEGWEPVAIGEDLFLRRPRVRIGR